MDTTAVAADVSHRPGPSLAVRLESFGPADIDRLIGWVPSARFLLQFAGSSFHFPLTRAQIEAHLTMTAKREQSRIYKAVLESTGEVVGHGEIGAVDQSNRSAFIARVLVGPSALRGKGIGSGIVERILQVAFGELDLHRVALHVLDFNRAAMECYERSGFQHEGTLRDARRHGQEYLNVCIMSVLKHEWEAIRPAKG